MIWLGYRFFFYLVLIFILPKNHDFGRWKQHLFDILFFTHLPKKIILKNLVELPFNSTFDFKYLCSTGDEWNLVYNKNNNNCTLINK